MKIFNFFLILKTVYSCFEQNQITNSSSLVIYKNDVYNISNYDGIVDSLNFTQDLSKFFKVGILCGNKTEPTSTSTNPTSSSSFTEPTSTSTNPTSSSSFTEPTSSETTKRPRKTKTTTQNTSTTIFANYTTTKQTPTT